jgi:thiol-disulfide isomerase/thioredoxin
MAQYAREDERSAFLQLEACEQLSLEGPPEGPLAHISAASEAPASEPFPTLAEEQRRLAAVLPGWLGIHYRAPERAERSRVDLPSGASVVREVLPDSPGSEAGLEVLDVLLGPPGAPFSERHAVREWVMQGEIGRPLPLRILRDDQELEVTVRLAPYPLELPQLPGPPEIGSVAPALELEYLADVRPPDPTRPRLYFFWETWCSHCKHALPELTAFAAERDVPIVAITDEAPETVQAFLRNHDGPVPEIVATDRRRTSFRDYGVSGTPTFVLVDAEGIVRHYSHGYNTRRGLDIAGW